MIECKISKKEIFKSIVCFALATGFWLNGSASAFYKDIQARKRLVEKYKSHKLISARLETILVIGLSEAKDENMEKVNKFFNAPHDIADEKSPKATEALVDLLDFELGYMIGETIIQLISIRGKEALPFLKNRISQKPYSSEKTTKERNSDIIMLIKAASCGVKYIVGGKHYTKDELIKFYLFYVQMDLEKYYREKGRYPKDLSQTYWTAPSREIIEREDYMGQELKYKSYGEIYFLCTLGEDGKFGTKDDVKPPYNTDVFSFPENFKE